MLRLLKLTRSSLLRYSAGLIGVAAALLFLYPNLAQNLFATATPDLRGFMPHGHCYYWVPSLVILHVLSDSIIGISYVAISVTLAYLVHRARRDIPFHWVFLAFGLFIVACGATHFMEILTVWHATYWLSGYVKLVTAAASLATAVVLPAIVPKTLGMANDAKTSAARKLELEAINRELRSEISRRKRAEQELKEFAQRLERSNNELQNFASIASHDLQEPLRKVQAFGDRLKSKHGAALNEEAKDYLDRMQNAAGRMQTLIDDLLTLSRITIQAKPFVPVDLQVVANEVLADLEVLIEKTKGQVEVGELATIDADPTQMRQLLQNLIGNALKFSRPDVPPTVKITGQIINQTDISQSTGGAASIYRLTVADNGIGFDEKNAERIFKVFQRLHGRSEYEGTGIGLAVCRKIAERHNGSIAAQSVPGEGATFTVDLPITASEKINGEINQKAQTSKSNADEQKQ